MARKIEVEILGDARSVTKMFQDAGRSASTWNKQLAGQAAEVKQVAAAEESLIKVRSRRASSLGPFRLAGVGLGAGGALFAATQAVRELGQSLETTGQEAFTTEGRLKNMVAALTTGDLVGAVKGLTAVPKTIEEMGVQLYEIKRNEVALREVADGLTTQVGDQSGAFSQATFTTTMSAAAMERFRKVSEETGGVTQEQAKIQLEYKEAADTARVATDALEGSIARLGQAFVTQSGAIVDFKGHVDDLDRMRGPGAFPQGAAAGPSRFAQPDAFLSPSQRRELGLIGQEGTERIGGLQARLRELQGQLERGTSTNKQRLRIVTNIRNTEAEIAGIQADQAAAQKAAAEAARRAEEAAAAKLKRLRDEIKSAILDRLQARQTDVLNKRALADAQEQLRIARQIGGPKGIQGALRGLQDVRFDMMYARLQAAPVSLTKGGQFAFGGVVININGVTDPDAVARKVTEILKKRSRRTTTQTRPTAAGQTG